MGRDVEWEVSTLTFTEEARSYACVALLLALSRSHDVQARQRNLIGME